MKQKKSFNSICTSCDIRMKLLWIWTLKNLSIILKTLFVVFIILIAANAIDGELFLSLFGVDRSEIETIDWNSFNSVKNILASLISIGMSVIVFLKKTKHLAIEDIKSRDLKIALIRANLYFNEHGKLCKRIETVTKVDINNDHCIGEQHISEVQSENLITGIPRAAGELATILTVKIDLDEAPEIVEEPELNEALTVPDIETTDKLYTEDLGAPEQIENTEIEPEEPKKKKSLNPFAEFFRAFKMANEDIELNDIPEPVSEKKETVDETPIEETKSPEIEVDEYDEPEEIILTTNVAEDVAAVVDIPKEENKVEQTTVVVQKKQTTTTTTYTSSKAQQINDILNNL